MARKLFAAVFTRFLLVLVIMLYGNNVLSQKYSLAELLNLAGENVDDFDTHVTKKGYKFWKQEEDRSQIVGSVVLVRKYAFKQNGNNQKAINFISLSTHKNGDFYELSYQTSDKDEYVALKTQLKAKGYSFDGTKNGSPANALVYRSGSSTINLVSDQCENGIGEMVTCYMLLIEQ